MKIKNLELGNTIVGLQQENATLKDLLKYVYEQVSDDNSLLPHAHGDHTVQVCLSAGVLRHIATQVEKPSS